MLTLRPEELSSTPSPPTRMVCRRMANRSSSGAGVLEPNVSPRAPQAGYLSQPGPLAHRSDPYQPASSYATFPRERGGRATVTVHIAEREAASRFFHSTNRKERISQSRHLWGLESVCA